MEKKNNKRKAETDLNIDKEKEAKSKRAKKHDKKAEKLAKSSNINDKLERSVSPSAEKLKKEPEKKTINTKGKQGTLDLFNIKVNSSPTLDFEKLPEMPKNSSLKISSWNVNGLRAQINKGSFEKFVKGENPDIFCLNETKIDITALKKEKFDKLYSEDYLSFWNCCKVKSGYSGVAIFTKYRPISVTYGIDHPAHDDEGRVITIEFEDFYLVSVYVPNAGEGLKRLDYRIKEWDIAFQSYLHSLKDKKDLILCGDLNVAHKEIDIHKPKGNEKSSGFTIQERESFSKFLDTGYIDTFRHLYPEVVKYSWFTARQKTAKSDNKGWRLDYFVINLSAEERLINSDILYDYDGSDHVPITLSWKI